MLPAETLADVASFLGYYDLDGLSFSNKMLSAVANECAEAIRLFDFSGFAFFIDEYSVSVYKLDADGDCCEWVCHLEVTVEQNLVDFVSKAFRNCIIGRLMLMKSPGHVQSAIKGVANTVVVGTLDVAAKIFQNAQHLFEYVESFRRVK
ncbi:hypothetical protein AAVH_09983, partial [Aphelenchoides avenae]